MMMMMTMQMMVMTMQMMTMIMIMITMTLLCDSPRLGFTFCSLVPLKASLSPELLLFTEDAWGSFHTYQWISCLFCGRAFDRLLWKQLLLWVLLFFFFIYLFIWWWLLLLPPRRVKKKKMKRNEIRFERWAKHLIWILSLYLCLRFVYPCILRLSLRSAVWYKKREKRKCKVFFLSAHRGMMAAYYPELLCEWRLVAFLVFFC